MNETHDGASAGATDKAQEVAAQAMERVDELKGRASDRIRGQLDARSNQLGDQIEPLGHALRTAAAQLELQHQESGAKAARRIAGHADRLSGYLHDSNSDRLLGDVEGFARRRPWAAGGLGVALGFVAARFLKASSESRYATMTPRPQDALPASDLPLRREAEATSAQPVAADYYGTP